MQVMEIAMNQAKEELFTFKEFSNSSVREMYNKFEVMYKSRCDRYETRLFQMQTQLRELFEQLAALKIVKPPLADAGEI